MGKNIDTTKCFDFDMIRSWLTEILVPFQGVPPRAEEHSAAAAELRAYLDETILGRTLSSCLADEPRPRNVSEAKPGRVYRVVETDNFGGDYPNESFEGPCMTYEDCERVAEIFNKAVNAEHGGRRFYKTEHESYELEPGFEP